MGGHGSGHAEENQIDLNLFDLVFLKRCVTVWVGPTVAFSHRLAKRVWDYFGTCVTFFLGGGEGSRGSLDFGNR